MLTRAQQTALAVALKSETDAGVVAAIGIKNISFLVEWCNGLSTTYAWNTSVAGTDLFEASDVTKFDGLTAGKRDAWRMMLDFAPIDMSKLKNRKAVQDVWGNTDSVAVLQDMRRKATRGEAYLGGTSATTNTVTAIKLNYVGSLSIDDIATALNENP